MLFSLKRLLKHTLIIVLQEVFLKPRVDLTFSFWVLMEILKFCEKIMNNWGIVNGLFIVWATFASSGATDRAAASQRWICRFDPDRRWWLCKNVACSLCHHVGFFRLLQFPPTRQRHAGCKLPLVCRECMRKCDSIGIRFTVGRGLCGPKGLFPCCIYKLNRAEYLYQQ